MMPVLRLVQLVLAAMLSLHALLIAFTNLTDYQVNFEFLRMVAGMSDTCSAQKTWRSVSNPVLLHGMYLLIIAAEATSGVLCGLGAWRMWNNRLAPDMLFEAGKQTAVKGALTGVALWFGALLTISGEWFLMWQSKTWNATSTAVSLAVFYSIALSVLLKKD